MEELTAKEREAIEALVVEMKDKAEALARSAAATTSPRAQAEPNFPSVDEGELPNPEEWSPPTSQT